jgi:hypothetical protein
MKFKALILPIFTLLTIAFLTSCNEVAIPTIDMHELGYENTKTVQRGNDLHVEADIVAEGKISKIIVTIHPEEHGGNHDTEWEVDQTFTEFEGLKNTEFHKHFEVPADAETGMYHFHLQVQDMEGNTEGYETEIEVTE